MGLGTGLLLTMVRSTHHLYTQRSWCHHLISVLYFWLELAFFFFLPLPEIPNWFVSLDDMDDIND